MRIRRALSFNDVLLVPRHTGVFRRSDVDLSTKIASLQLGIPIIAGDMFFRVRSGDGNRAWEDRRIGDHPPDVQR